MFGKKEIEEVLGTDAKLFCDFFNITETGNWEGKNIPWILKKRLTLLRKESLI